MNCLVKIALLLVMSTLSIGVHTTAFAQTANSKAETFMEQAVDAEQAKDYLRAAKYYKALLKHEVLGERAVEGFVRVTAKLKNPEEPEASLYRLVTEQNPFSAAAHLALAEIYSRQERIELGLEEVAIFEKLRPESTAAETLKVSLLMRGEDYQSAINLVTTILKRPGEHPVDLRMQRGIAYYKLKRFQDAAADLEVAARSKEPPKGVQQRLLRCYVALNNAPAIEESAKLWTQAEPKSSQAWEAYGDAVTKNKPLEAISAYEKSAALDKDDLSVRVKIANIHFALKDWQKTQTACKEVLKLDPANERAARQLVAVYAANKQTDEMGRFLKTHAVSQPEQSWAAIAYVQALNDVGLVAPAAELIDTSIMTQTDANSQFAAAYVLVSSGRFDEAAEKLSAYVKQSPSDQGHYNLGQAYEAAGKFAEASASYNKVSNGSSIWFKAQYNRAMIMERNGQLDPALATFRALQAKDPTARNVALKITAIEDAKSNSGARMAAKSLDGTLPYRQWEFAQ